MAETYQIKVSFTRFPSYAPILQWYNEHKPADWRPIAEAGIAEGGFQVPLTSVELKALRETHETLDPNDYVRQLEWHNGQLRQHNGFATLRNDETILLCQALQALFGPDKVELIRLA